MAGRGLGGLLRERDFRLLWIGETTSSVGTAITGVALPLVAISVLHASTFAVASLTAAVWLPWVLVGMPAGAWIDRIRKRPVMICCDLVSVALFASVPLASWTGILTLGQLYVVAGGAGVAAVFFRTAWSAYLPTVLAEPDRPEGNTKLNASTSAANLAGPGLAGIIARGFGAATGLLADAASFVASAACLLAIRREEPPLTRAAPTTLRRDITDGIRLATADPYLRALTLWGGFANFTLTLADSVTVLFLVRTVHVDAATVGILLAAGSSGGILGALLATPICRRYGTARGLLICELGGAPFAMLMPLTHPGAGLGLFVAGLFLPVAGVVAGNVIQHSFSQSYVPAHQLARINATQNVFNYGTMPIAALLAGALGTAIGVRATLWVATAGLVATEALLLASPIRTNRDLPTRMPQAAPVATVAG